MSEDLGVVVGGSLAKSLEIRLHPGRAAALGQYVMAPLEGGGQVLGMVTDVLLKAAESGPTAWPPPAGDDPASRLLRDVLHDTAVYSAIEASPYLEVPVDGGEPSRARRLPRHFAPVALADQSAMDRAFNTGVRPSIPLGSPLGMDAVDICVDHDALFERSAGIFGKSGTGKSTLALQLLDAMVARSAGAPTNSDRTVAIVFDMHDDYGDEMKFQGGGRLPSLKGRHRSHVSVYSLDADAPNVDSTIVVGTRDIEPEDLDVLQSTAYFTTQAVEAAYELRSRFGKEWIDEIHADDPSPAVIRKVWAGEEPDEVNWNRVASRLGIHGGSLDNLRRGLRRIVRRDFVKSGAAQFSGVIDHVVQTLQGGKSVVVQFGRAGSDLTSYMLIANMLSRRIWAAYRDAVERALRAKDGGVKPNRLVIVIEEAHKFVDKSMAGQSIFGQIARELRKYNVTLLVIDQRPSQIDPEVLSQVGTKFCLQLDSEQDVDALVGGMSGRAGLRHVIATLESRQQTLAFGHALPMPVVLRTPDAMAFRERRASLLERLGVSQAAVEPGSPAGLYG